MEVKYKNRILLAIFGFVMLVLSILKIQGIGKSFIDYEGFDFEAFIFLWIGFYMVYSSLLTPRIKLHENTLETTGVFKNNVFSYDEIEDVSRWFDTIRFRLKNGTNYLVNISNLSNYKEVRIFLLETKSIKKQPFYGAFSLSVVLHFSMILIFIGFTVSLIGKGTGAFKLYLPLQSIEVVEIEGEVSENTSVDVLGFKGRPSLVTVGLGLKAYPGVSFYYPRESRKLQNNILLYNQRENPIEKNTYVKIKIRKEDYQKLNKLISKLEFSELEKSRTSMKFYAMEIDDKVMMEKCGIRTLRAKE